MTATPRPVTLRVGDRTWRIECPTCPDGRRACQWGTFCHSGSVAAMPCEHRDSGGDHNINGQGYVTCKREVGK
jgi:hypothetical protein